jgi:osmotically-inducible protein OsmY
MRSHLLLLVLALFLSTADATSRQVPDSSPATGAAATPGAAAILGGPSSAEDNQELRERILNALHAHSSLASSTIDVEVSDSWIVLSGSVPTAREKETARRIAQSYGNNRSVVDSKIGVRNIGGTPGAAASQR